MDKRETASPAAGGEREPDLRLTFDPPAGPTEIEAVVAALAILGLQSAGTADWPRPVRSRWAIAGRREALRSSQRLAAGWRRRDGGWN